MKKKIKKIIWNPIVIVAVVIVALITGGIALKLYFNMIDQRALEVMNSTDSVYITKNNVLNSNGFYVANLKEELTEYVKDQNVSSVSYKFDGESFYFNIKVDRDKDGDVSFEIEKIANPEFGIKAMMHMKDIESVEYRTGNQEKSSVLKLNQKYSSDYFAMIEDTYYFLGNDIESLSFRDNQFYYMSYNPNYKTLETAKSCSKEVKNSIDDFNMNHYYYKYGKINFLRDYYQKLASKTFTVQNKCDALAKGSEE